MSFSLLGQEAQIVCVPDTLYDDFPLTIMCWYKPATADETDRKWLFGIMEADNVGIQALVLDSDDIYKVLSINTDGAGEFVVSSGVSSINGTWQFILATFTALAGAGARAIFVDSATASASSAATATAIGGVQYAIGGRYVAGGADLNDHPNGDIAEVALWNEVLSAAQIANLYTDRYAPDRVSTPEFYMPLQSSLMRQLGSEATRANQIAEAAGGPIIDFTEHSAIGIAYGSGPVYSGA